MLFKKQTETGLPRHTEKSFENRKNLIPVCLSVDLKQAPLSNSTVSGVFNLYLSTVLLSVNTWNSSSYSRRWASSKGSSPWRFGIERQTWAPGLVKSNRMNFTNPNRAQKWYRVSRVGCSGWFPSNDQSTGSNKCWKAAVRRTSRSAKSSEQSEKPSPRISSQSSSDSKSSTDCAR